MSKRLCHRINPEEFEEVNPVVPIEATSELYIIHYSPKSFVVLGETLDHTDALMRLGGKYTELRNLSNKGWLFAKIREESVKKYINTGEIEPYVYSKEDRAKFEKQKEDPELKIKKIFRELKEAFDIGADYEGVAILDVIAQFEKQYL